MASKIIIKAKSPPGEHPPRTLEQNKRQSETRKRWWANKRQEKAPPNPDANLSTQDWIE